MLPALSTKGEGVSDSMVYVKCLLPEAETKGVAVHCILGKEWNFNPYQEMSLADFKKAVGFLNYSPGEFEVVSAEEYEDWFAVIAEAAAAVMFCGDFGGVKTNGDFCWKRVDAEGNRCEHHGGKDEELQGSYGRVERPEMPEQVAKRCGNG